MLSWLISAAFYFLQDNSMYSYSIIYIYFNVLKYIFFLNKCWGCGLCAWLGVWSDFPSFLSLADHMPDYSSLQCHMIQATTQNTLVSIMQCPVIWFSVMVNVPDSLNWVKFICLHLLWLWWTLTLIWMCSWHCLLRKRIVLIVLTFICMIERIFKYC